MKESSGVGRVAAWICSHISLKRLKKESTGVGVTGDECLDDIDDLLLLMARQFADGFKNAASLARGAGAALLGGVNAQEIVCRDAQGGGQSDQLCGPERDGLALPPAAANGVQEFPEKHELQGIVLSAV